MATNNLEITIKVNDLATASLKGIDTALKGMLSSFNAAGGANKFFEAMVTSLVDLSKGLKLSTAEIAKLTKTLKDVKPDKIKDADKDIKDLGKDSKATTEDMKGLEKQSQAVAQAFTGIAGALAAIGLTAAVKEAVNKWTEYSDKMLSVKALSGATATEFEKLSAMTANLGQTTRFTASQAAQGLEYLAMSGMKVKDQLTLLPEVLKFASAGQLELGDAANISTNVLSGLRKGVEELPGVMDIMADAAASTNTNVLALGDAFKIAGPASVAAGESIQAVTAVLSTLAKAGIQGSESGNAFKRMEMALVKPTDNAKEALQRMGVATKDADGKYRGIIPILKDMAAAQKKAKDPADNLSNSMLIFGKYAATSANAVVGLIDETVAFEKQFDQSTGRVNVMSATLESGIGGALRSLGSAWESVQLSVGQGFDVAIINSANFFTTELRSLAGAIQELIAPGEFQSWVIAGIDAFERTYTIVKSVAGVFFELGGQLKPVFIAFSGIVPYVVTFGAAMGTLKIATAAYTIAANASVASMTLLKTGFTGITAGVTSANLAVSILSKAFIALAAIWGAFKIVEAVQEWHNMNKAIEEAKVHTDALYEATAKTKDKYAEFKDLQMPDLTGKSIEELTTLQQNLGKTKAYWSAMYEELRVKASEESFFFGKTSDAIAAQAELEKVKAKYASVNSEIFKVSQTLKIAQQEAGRTSTATVAGFEASNRQVKAFEQGVKKAYDEATKSAEKFSKEAEKFAEKQYEANLTTEDKLRALKQKAMTDEEAWNDKKLQAEEKLAAARALANQPGGSSSEDMEKAVELAKQAQDIYVSLGEKVSAVSKDQSKAMSETLPVAEAGVKATGDIIDEIYESQKVSAQEMADNFKKNAEEMKATLDEVAKQRTADIIITVDNIQEWEDRINALTKDETKHIKVIKTGGGSDSGSSDSELGFQVGGKVPGYGGGDRYGIKVEGGEWIIRKSRSKIANKLLGFINNAPATKVKDFVSGAFSRQVARAKGFDLSKFVSDNQPKPVNKLAWATGGMTPEFNFQGFSDMGTLNVVLPSGNSGKISGNKSVLAALNKELSAANRKRYN